MCILKCFDKIPDMSSSALASLGLGVLTGDVYKKVLAVVIERDLGPDSVTNQFVLELKSYVAEQSRGGKGAANLPPDKMTIRQACHLLAMLADKAKFPNEECIDINLRLKLWKVRDMFEMFYHQ